MNLKSDLPLCVESKTGKTFIIFLFFSFLGVLIWFTPLPNAPEESCDRPCHELEWPRICRLQFVLESHTIPHRNCNEISEVCTKDEFEFGIGNTLLTVNRQIPGPVIHVCVHDILLIDVINRVPGKSVSIHWRGQVHRNNPLMDGVSMITQCPVTSFSTFQYKFRASNSGTHMWHLHNNENNNAVSNNIYGMLVVRESVRTDPHRKIMDYDKSDNVLVLRGIKVSYQSAILINGRFSMAKDDNEAQIKFDVKKNKRYRFRIAHSGGEIECPITGSVDNHHLLIIALDGNPIEPIYTFNFTIVAGERLDFVLRTTQVVAKYKMKFTFSNCEMKSASFVTLNYVEEKEEEKRYRTEKEDLISFPFTPTFTTSFENICGKTATCLEKIKSQTKLPGNVLIEEPDTILYLFYGYRTVQLGSIKGIFKIAEMNNITFIYPPSPLASQSSDVPLNIICNENTKPSYCLQQESEICYCTHVINVELGKIVELFFIHREMNGKRDHIFHLHGHQFYVLGRRKIHDFKTLDDIRNADKNENLLIRNLENPVIKDTILVPRKGIAAIRFVADNAGYWLLKEEGNGSQGMEVVFNVFGSAYNIPESFPQCGDWIGPKYFLA